jgi:DNA-binding NtrC family response regulator
MKIVIFNDELRSEMQMYLMLSNMHDVIVARDMEDLLQLLDQINADLTFLDLTVQQEEGEPERNVLDLAGEIRHRHPGTRLIGIYDHGDSTVPQQAHHHGITALISRPIKNRELMQLIEN